MANEQPILMRREDAKILQDVVRAVRGARGSGGVQVHYAPGGGVTIALRSAKPRRPPNASAIATRFIVVEEFEDHLRCRKPEDVGETSQENQEDPDKDVSVLKPDDLRGWIAERDLNEGLPSQPELPQKIYPQYKPTQGSPVVYFDVYARPMNPTTFYPEIFWLDANFPTHRDWIQEDEIPTP